MFDPAEQVPSQSHSWPGCGCHLYESMPLHDSFIHMCWTCCFQLYIFQSDFQAYDILRWQKQKQILKGWIEWLANGGCWDFLLGIWDHGQSGLLNCGWVITGLLQHSSFVCQRVFGRFSNSLSLGFLLCPQSQGGFSHSLDSLCMPKRVPDPNSIKMWYYHVAKTPKTHSYTEVFSLWYRNF